MARCPGCGADIQHGRLEGQEDTSVPLEMWTESGPSPDRYRIVQLGPPLVVAPVAERALGDAYPDHRKDCPAHANGL